jgi:ABC-type Fe3+ transport system permease subunit
MPFITSDTLWIGSILLVILAVIIVLIIGVFYLIQYAKTRRKAFLITGLMLTFLLPGILLCLGFLLWLPNVAMGYGPPPSNYAP